MRSILFPAIVIVVCGSVLSGEQMDRANAAAERSIAERVAGRDFPSVFQAWSPADNLKGREPLALAAKHDLIWHGVEWFGLEWAGRPRGLPETLRPESIPRGRAKREALLKLNPNIILVAEIRYRDADRAFLPRDHKWWARDKGGNLLDGWDEGGFVQLDFRNPEFREHVARRAKAVAESGVVDGVMLDWWSDDEYRLALVKAVREAIGENHLIIANANDRTTPLTAPYINGYFMECYASRTADDWRRITATLGWAERNLREPRVNCVETWYHKSRDDLNLMRATTTLALTHSNGYCLFSDPNPLPSADHRHNWYGFWDKSLAKPAGSRIDRPDGAVLREFEKGTVVYNPMGNKPVNVEFADARKSLATGKAGKRHTVGSCDGDIFLKTQ